MDEGIYIPTWWLVKALRLQPGPAVRLALAMLALDGVESDKGWTGPVSSLFALAGMAKN